MKWFLENIDLKHSAIAMTIIALVSWLVSYFMSINFWLPFLFMFSIGTINSIIAEVADNRPGSFREPVGEKPSKSVRFDRNFHMGAAKKRDISPDRVLVWQIFSSFYLDSELTEEDRQTMALTLASLPFSITELAHIAYYEVSPACYENLFYWWWGCPWACIFQSKAATDSTARGPGNPAVGGRQFHGMAATWQGVVEKS